MIISIRSLASSEERAQLLALLGRVTQHQQSIMPSIIDGCEVIILDGSKLDVQADTLLRQQGAVERVIAVKTPYKLVSRSFKPEGSSMLVGTLSGAEAVTIGGAASPVIIAGPCAVENREHTAGYSKGGEGSGRASIARGSLQTAHVSLPVSGTGSRGLAVAGGGQGSDGSAGDYRGDGAGVSGDGGRLRGYLADRQPQYAELPSLIGRGTQ